MCKEPMFHNTSLKLRFWRAMVLMIICNAAVLPFKSKMTLPIALRCQVCYQRIRLRQWLTSDEVPYHRSRFLDGIYFVVQSAVSARAITMEDGLVVIDARNNAEEAGQILILGLQYFEHDGTWEATEVADGGTKEGTGEPRKDRMVTDGQGLTFGSFSIRFLANPGYTLGDTGLVLPGYDHGNRHLVVLSGETGKAQNASAEEDQIESYFKLATITEESGVDTLLASHQTQNRSLTNFESLKEQQCVPRGCLREHPSRNRSLCGAVQSPSTSDQIASATRVSSKSNDRICTLSAAY
ncbi:hypothetical protein AC579_885 [Pseudocercospora musae]|uniref:Uncharacterized protein n=1 Tax=Pseudocercospora musae TaxID=113226 RepID=A0A139IN87_9PEZI|nr:hypothetical protein AC579_885 [Pseudocercospora musae]